MSTQLNERQLLAAQYLAIGLRPSEVAEKLSVARETVSRWQQQAQFQDEIYTARSLAIKQMSEREYYLIELAQTNLESFFCDEEISPFQKATIALKYMSQYSGKTTLHARLEDRNADTKYGSNWI